MPVANAAPDTESAWSGAKMPPVAQRGDGWADHSYDPGDGRQFVVARAVMARVVVLGRGVLLVSCILSSL